MGVESIDRPRDPHTHGRRVVSRLDRSQCHCQQRPIAETGKSWTTELTAERDLGNRLARATLFFENTNDALYSQTNVSVIPNVTNIQNIDAIRTRGLELAYQATDVVWRGFDLSSSLTFADSIITRNDKFPDSVGKWQPRVPRWRADVRVRYRFNKQWSLAAGIDNLNNATYRAFHPYPQRTAFAEVKFDL